LARITFTDALGRVDFTNGYDTLAQGVASRFGNWTPFQRPVGAVATGLGTGARAMFRFRTDYGASFEMTEIPALNLAAALRLQAHLLDGGTVQVVTDDAFGRVYNTCCLAPDADVGVTLADRSDLVYTMTFTLINLDATPMLCDYSPSIGPNSILFAWQVSNAIPAATFSRTGPATFVTRA
jgi:hypothetical protein